MDRRRVSRATLVLMTLAVATIGAGGGPASARDACEELWYERNAIFKDAGYCFKTSRAIRAFGNAGCLYDDEADVPLTPFLRRRVAELRAQERYHGCR